MLDIATFDAVRGGNVLYKALVHPLAAEAMQALFAKLAERGPVAIYDPADTATALAQLHKLDAMTVEGVYVQDVRAVGTTRLGHVAKPVTELKASKAGAVLVAAFDAGRLTALAKPWMPPTALVATLDEAALPEAMRSNVKRVLDPLNYVANFALFRDAGGVSTRLVSANYWAGYGAKAMRLWLRLYDMDGRPILTWEETLPDGPGGIALDSREIRARFGLPEFEGHLYLHAIGCAGHDVMKYVLDTYASDGGPTLSGTHDANPWPADRYAGLPAPKPGEQVLVWLENPHPQPIPAGAIGLGRMGREDSVVPVEAIPAFGVRAVDIGKALPAHAWPDQLELHAGRHLIRPRYEVLHGPRRRIAHVNVERSDLEPDPGIPGIAELMGRGFLLPFPVLDPGRFRSIVLPTPMSTGQRDLPLALEVFAEDGRPLARRFLGCLPRDHALALDVAEMLAEEGVVPEAGHAELVYDFRDGGGADGWLHGLFRYEDVGSGHVAESSFGSHIYNTIVTYKSEPQSYAGPAPGLSTRLFLGLPRAGRTSFCVLIHPSSRPEAAAVQRSSTSLLLHDGAGQVIAETWIAIAACGSKLVQPHLLFDAASLRKAGETGYVLVRDTTCRLFGYQGLMGEGGAFSLDHMFGF
ncbi:hypothetical protein [Falsiroseomonas sp. HW251]|uniref:hypothetical protein n=1 Tax=Falsiroseomonas sp. HW251 TaxID=3390998 RepID=UPI003D321661